MRVSEPGASVSLPSTRSRAVVDALTSRYEERLSGRSRGVADESDEVLMVRVAQGDVPAYRDPSTTATRTGCSTSSTATSATGSRPRTCARRLPQALPQPPRLRSQEPLRHLAVHGGPEPLDRQLRRKRPATSLQSATDDEEDFVPEPESEASVGPIDVTLMRELEDKVQEVLMTLSDKLREVFVLCAIQGLSYEEVAPDRGLPRQDVSSRLSRGAASDS